MEKMIGFRLDELYHKKPDFSITKLLDLLRQDNSPKARFYIAVIETMRSKKIPDHEIFDFLTGDE